MESGGVQGTQPKFVIFNSSSRFNQNALRKVLHGNIKFLLRLVGTVVAILVITKLAEGTIPLHTRLPVIFMVTSWASVQTLYMASNRRDASLIDTEHTVCRALELEKKLNQTTLWAVLSLLLLPLFEYLTSIVLFQMSSLANLVEWILFLLGVSLIILSDSLNILLDKILSGVSLSLSFVVGSEKELVGFMYSYVMIPSFSSDGILDT